MVLASSNFLAREMLKRNKNSDVFLVIAERPSSSSGELGAKLSPEVEKINLLRSLPIAGSANLIWWSEPEKHNGRELLAEIERNLAPGGKLIIVTSNWMACFLPEWKHAHEHPAQNPAGGKRTVRWLKKSGFLVKTIHGVRSVVADGKDGYLVKICDTNDLIDKLGHILSLPEKQRHVMGKAGREKVVERYAWERISEKLESIYQAVLNQTTMHELSKSSGGNS